MEKKNGFYITLPSNASQHIYPNNKIWNFRTKLAKPIVLNEPYEVGLIEFQYPRNWNTFSKSDSHMCVYNAQKKKEIVVYLSTGYYGSIRQILTEIYSVYNDNDLLDFNIYHNPITNKVLAQSVEPGGITFTGRLAEILGFHPDKRFALTKSAKEAPRPADIHGGRYNIFIYTDIVDYQAVGDAHVPLLRCINVANDNRPFPILTYDRPHYTPVSKTVIDDIEIAIKDDQNQFIPFLYGKVIVKLHFRPARHYF